MQTIGIDPSYTGTGIIVLNTDTGELKDQKLVSTPENISEIVRAEQVWQEIKNLFTVPIDVIAIEGLAFANGNKAHQMGYLHYRLREYLESSEMKPLVVIPSPTQLKKFVTGKGQAKKELMLLNVYKRWGVEFDDNNLADSYGLAQIGRAYIGAETKLTKYQQEVISAIKNPKTKKKVKK